jgi:anti-anti-sigma factor
VRFGIHLEIVRDLIVRVTIEEVKNTSLIRLEGDVDIASSEEVKSILIDALASKIEIRLMLEDATELDITALQLLYAAERDAAQSKIPFTLDGSVPSEITSAMTDAGFAKFHFQQQ